MIGIPKVITLGLHLAGILQIGLASNLSENEFNILNEVSQNLPLAKCDMIIVSSEPYEGEILGPEIFLPMGCVKLGN